MHHNYSVKSSCLMIFMILLKYYVWEKSGSGVTCKNSPGQSDGRILKLKYLKNYWRHKVDFLHVDTYLLKLQVDVVVSHGWVRHAQACPKGLLKF